MLRRVLKHKQADRLLWATLFLLTLLGVAVAIKLKAEGQSNWVGGVPPPLAPPPAATAPPALAVQQLVVQQLTTPLELRVAAITPGCRSAIQAK